MSADAASGPGGNGAAVMPDPALAGLGRRQLHVVLVLDCSGSMTGEKIASLNFAVRSALPALREAAGDNPEVEVLVRAIRVSDAATWHVEAPIPAGRLEWSDLSAGGETATGAAMELLAEALARLEGRQLAPVLVLVSDGLPTDGFETGLSRLLATEMGARAVRIAIAIGGDADLDALERFGSEPGMRPLVAHDSEMLAGRIRWATTAPVRVASRPVGADADARRAAFAREAVAESERGGETGGKRSGAADDDLVW